jgi:hypothetical protein
MWHVDHVIALFVKIKYEKQAQEGSYMNAAPHDQAKQDHQQGDQIFLDVKYLYVEMT